MSTTELAVPRLEAKMTRKPGRAGAILFGAFLAAGITYTAWHLISDVSRTHTGSAFEFGLLGLALVIALGFEFVNGFHDTANAVATVIYTHTLEPNVAVVWSGMWNFIGVLTSSGAVAFGIVSLLPVELILKIGTNAGYAMVFALLFSAIIWNLGTWYFGIPNSSSHTLIGSILGVGIVNQMMSATRTGTSGVDWKQALEVAKSLFFSPLIGFVSAALLLLLIKKILPNPKLYSEPQGGEPPPFWIRGLLMLTCTGVSFAHGSNDGQKGMGLIMLILVGTVPTAYALNHAVGSSEVQTFIAISERADRVLAFYQQPAVSATADPKAALGKFIQTREYTADVVPAMRTLMSQVSQQVKEYKALALIPTRQTGNVRNDMYITAEAMRTIQANHSLDLKASDTEALAAYKMEVDRATKFIPPWVKVAVALALGLGTMVGWKRIVVTVGERIGKTHLTYAQGATSELVAMGTILAADRFGLPVSTTHVLTSGVGGTMAANHSGLQWSTLRNIVLAWFLTLPAAIVLAGGLFWLFRQM